MPITITIHVLGFTITVHVKNAKSDQREGHVKATTATLPGDGCL